MGWSGAGTAGVAVGTVAIVGITLHYVGKKRRERRTRHARRGLESPPRIVKEYAGAPAEHGVAGTARTRRFSVKFAEHLTVDVYLSPPPERYYDVDRPPLVVYILDPEPVLFGGCSSFSYMQACSFSKLPPGNYPEAEFRRMILVGIGHHHDYFRLDAQGYDADDLRWHRRRDFPPWTHPVFLEGTPGQNERPRNEKAQFFVDRLAQFIPRFEEEKLGIRSRPRRGILGASYTGVVALNMMINYPELFDDYVLGSPSVCFDPEIVSVLDNTFYYQRPRIDIGVKLVLGEKERLGTKLPGNVHDHMSEDTHYLGTRLRDHGIYVSGPLEIKGEDHTTIKFPLMSLGMTFFAERAMKAEKRRVAPMRGS